MVKINLRAWREERDEVQQKAFVTHLVFSVVIALAVVFAIGKYYDFQTDRQSERTVYLQSQISQLNTKIKEIEDLKKLKEKRLARLKTIQTLQGNRPLIVRYFDELVRVLPDGLYYTTLKRVGDILTVNGMAERNQDVSSLMRNLYNSSWFGEPDLTSVGGVSAKRVFNLNVQLSKGVKDD